MGANKWWVVRYTIHTNGIVLSKHINMVYSSEDKIKDYIQATSRYNTMIVCYVGFDKRYKLNFKEKVYCAGDNVAEANLLGELITTCFG